MARRVEDDLIKKEAKNQNLTFNVFKNILKASGYNYLDEEFEKENHLLTKDGKYNIIADLVSDQSPFSFMVFIFDGKQETDEVLYQKDFGHQCIFKMVEEVMMFINSFNRGYSNMSDNRRHDLELFNPKKLLQTCLKALIHTYWPVKEQGPIISIFEDRIEISFTTTSGLNRHAEVFSYSNNLLDLFSRLGYQLEIDSNHRPSLRIRQIKPHCISIPFNPQVLEIYGKTIFDSLKIAVIKDGEISLIPKKE
jgi:hypothetical protein